MKKKVALLAGLLVAMVVANGQSTPLKRFDKGTESCRVFGFESGWWGEGKKTFVNGCQNCHHRDNSVKAPFLHSESLSPAAWNRVFFQKYPKCAKDGSWPDMPLEAQLSLNDYLYRYGNGTYNPNSARDCG